MDGGSTCQYDYARYRGQVAPWREKLRTWTTARQDSERLNEPRYIEHTLTTTGNTPLAIVARCTSFIRCTYTMWGILDGESRPESCCRLARGVPIFWIYRVICISLSEVRSSVESGGGFIFPSWMMCRENWRRRSCENTRAMRILVDYGRRNAMVYRRPTYSTDE